MSLFLNIMLGAESMLAAQLAKCENAGNVNCHTQKVEIDP